MTTTNCEKITLAKGEMTIYHCGQVQLQAYKTNDFIDNEVFLLVKEGEAVIIESPCFFDNNRELAEYMAKAGLKPTAMLIAYHAAGGSFLPDIPKYATQNAVDYGYRGGGKALIDNFTAAFGAIFDSSLHKIDHIIEAGQANIGGWDFIIHPTPEAYDLEIPAINAVYTHMLGHDCHSIVAGPEQADALIAQLETYLTKGYNLILTSHYTPENLKDVSTKIAYLKDLKAIAANCANGAEFKKLVQAKYSNYSGENYLDMTVNFFFQQ